HAAVLAALELGREATLEAAQRVGARTVQELALEREATQLLHVQRCFGLPEQCDGGIDEVHRPRTLPRKVARGRPPGRHRERVSAAAARTQTGVLLPDIRLAMSASVIKEPTMKSRRIGVLMGGLSSERQISLETGQ